MLARQITHPCFSCTLLILAALALSGPSALFKGKASVSVVILGSCPPCVSLLSALTVPPVLYTLASSLELDQVLPPLSHAGCPLLKYRFSAALLASGTWNFNPAASFACQLCDQPPFLNRPSYILSCLVTISPERRVCFLAAKACLRFTGNLHLQV